MPVWKESLMSEQTQRPHGSMKEWIKQHQSPVFITARSKSKYQCALGAFSPLGGPYIIDLEKKIVTDPDPITKLIK